jgi:RNA polymerase sigma-70 factor (ECF subfamily)
LAVLDRVLNRLQADWIAAGEEAAFERLKGCLAGSQAEAYAEIGASLGKSEGAVRVAVHRLRRQYRELLRDEIAQTVAGPEEVDDEIRHLFTCVR